MKLDDEEQAMLAGTQGRVAQIAIEHQIKVGDFFDATDRVDPEIMEAGEGESWV